MNTPIRLAATLLAFSFAARLVSAADLPKPGAEHKRLDYYLGSWTFESTVAASPYGPAGKNTGKQTCERGPGGFSVVFHSDVNSTAGRVQGLAVMGYDSQKKSYHYYGVD